MPVQAGVRDQLGQAAFGLVDDAGEQADGGQVIAQPGALTLGESGECVVDQIISVVAAVRAGGRS